MPKICQTAKANFSLPNAFEKCQIWVIWHFKMPFGNPDNGHQTYWGHDLDLSGSCDVIGHV